MANIGEVEADVIGCRVRQVEFEDEPTVNGTDAPPNPLLSLMTAKARVPADKGKVGRASKVPVREVAFHVLSVL